MTKRETRVINAFINCVKTGQYTYEYAVTLLENAEKYGYLSNKAKEMFYIHFENNNEEMTSYED